MISPNIQLELVMSVGTMFGSEIAQPISICNLKNPIRFFLWEWWQGRKWIFYRNVKRKQSWGGVCDEPPQISIKAGLQPKKLLLSICQYWKSVVFYSFFLGQDYRLRCVYWQAVRTKYSDPPTIANRNFIVFQRDNFRQLISLQARQKILWAWLRRFAAASIFAWCCTFRFPTV